MRETQTHVARKACTQFICKLVCAYSHLHNRGKGWKIPKSNKSIIVLHIYKKQTVTVWKTFCNYCKMQFARPGLKYRGLPTETQGIPKLSNQVLQVVKINKL